MTYPPGVAHPTAPAIAPRAAKAQPPDLEGLREQCRKLESAFLSEMLSHAGLTRMGGDFGGGPGEDHFHSFMRQALADRMSARGGIGLAERLFDAMKGRHDAA